MAHQAPAAQDAQCLPTARAALVLGAAAWVAARRSLGAFETAVRHSPGALSSEYTLP